MRHGLVICVFLALCASCVVGQTIQHIESSFIGGEISPLIVSRPDSPRYNTGCREIENAMVLDVGIVARRPGTIYVAAAPGPARLEPFVYDDNDVYIMEFSDKLLRFYREVSGVPGIVVDANDDPYTVATPWDGNDVFRLNIYQKGDILYVAHRDYSPRKISRFGHTSWTIEDCNTLIVDGPFKDENTDTAITIDPPEAAANVTTGESFDANDVFFTYAADLAFNANFATNFGWVSDEIEDTWIRCTFSVAKTITRVKIWPCVNSAESDRCVRHCKIEGSNDGTSWTKIGVDKWYGRCQGYNGNEIEIARIANYTDFADVRLDNSTAYTQYRIWCYDNWGDEDYVGILETEMMEADSGTFIANSSIWNSKHVGSLWKLRHPRSASEINGSFGLASFSNSIPVKGSWDVSTTGTWSGTLVLQRSYDYGSSWETMRTWEDAGSIEATGIEEELNVWYRINMTAYTSGTCNYSLSVRDGTQSGIIRITGYTDPNEVTAEILTELGARDATYRWSEGAWSEDEGYPEAVAGHQARLIYAKDLTLWWSASYKFETFESGSSENDDDSFSWTISQARQNPIWWLVGDKGQSMVAGTMGRVLEIQPFDETVGFTPTNPPKVQNSVSVGSSRAQPALAEELLLYASPSGKRMHELMYNSSNGAVSAPDLTLLASHILGTGVRQLAWQSQPYPYLWAVRDDGEMSCLYYSRPYEIASWCREVTDGSFTSVAVAPRSEDVDRVWCVVNRTIDSNSVYYVECFDDIDFDAAIEDAYYVDCGLTWSGGDPAVITAITKASPTAVTLSSWPSGLSDGDQVKIESVVGMTEINDRIFTADDCNSTAMTLTLDNEEGTSNWSSAGYSNYTSSGTLTVVEDTFGGLSHLEGETVSYLGDGLYDSENGTAVVSGGSIQLAEYVNHLSVGLPYTTTITPVSPEIVGSGSSTTPFLKTEQGVYVNVYNTAGGQYGIVGGRLANIRYPSYITPGQLFSGAPDILRRQAGPRGEIGYTFQQAEPYPFILKTVVTLYEVTQ